MASNEAIYGLKLAWRAISGVATFKGRSRRTEIFYYWLAMLVLSLLLSPFKDPLLEQFAGDRSWQEQQLLSEAVGFLPVIPAFALFVRRVHDQDRSAWWALLLPPMLAVSVYKSLRFILLEPQTGAVTLPDLPGWVSLVGLPLALAWLTLVLFPGTRGPNRFGPDPRDEDPRAARLPTADAGPSPKI